MQESTHSSSFSAPKILGTSNSPIFKFNLSKQSPKVSPGESPSCFAIRNCPIDSSTSRSHDFFFNSEVPLNELHKLANIITIEEEDDEQISCLKKAVTSKSASQKPSKSPKLNSYKDICNENQAEEENQPEPCKARRELRFVPIKLPQVILQRPPVRPGNIKREKRGTFNSEAISYDRFSGSLKFYNLQKRFGFIKIDNEEFDAFICEDDLLISGQHLRKFKDDVYKKLLVNFVFNIKKYTNNEGVEKWKAVNIQIVPIT